MRKATLSEQLRYRFDNTMAKGTLALIGWLALLSILIIMIGALVLTIAGFAPEGGTNRGFIEDFWMGLMHTLDAGTLGGAQGTWGFRLTLLFVTIGGIFIISTLIGVLSSGIEAKIDELRKGRSVVLEKNHTIILGWSPQIFGIISELLLANANKPGSVIAIMGDKDKVEMEDEIRARVPNWGKTRIICRSGNPGDISDLEVINPYTSRSIIILAPEEGNPDSAVIKAILAITNNPKRRQEPYHIVAEINDLKNVEIAQMVGRDEAQLIVTGDLIARITVQTCRQSGLSVVYTELLDFGGDEIYFAKEPALAGKTFHQALLAYETSAIIGVRFADGRIHLNPPMDTVLAAGDMLVAISEDDDTIKISGNANPGIDTAAIAKGATSAASPESTLLLGWNERAETIITELDKYVVPGSRLHVVAEGVEEEESARMIASMQNQTLTFAEGDITNRRLLDQLSQQDYQHVIVLSYSERLDEQEADAQTLITLLHLRDIEQRTGTNYSIVSEMLDVRNRELAEVTHADDFIVSDKLVGLMLSQVSENRELAGVFADLFSAEGSEIYLKPASDYVQMGKTVNFYTIVEAAAQRGEVAIGYRLQSLANEPGPAHGVRINPKKSQNFTFTAEDKIVVLAEG